MKIITQTILLTILTVSIISCSKVEQPTFSPTISDQSMYDLDPNQLIEVEVKIIEYRKNAIHREVSDGHSSWDERIDKVIVLILSPPEWSEKMLEMSVGEYPVRNIWKDVGGIYRFSLETKYLVGEYPGDEPGTVDVYWISTGGIKNIKKIE
jgi:hypothetical protein